MTADIIEMAERLNASTTAVEPAIWLPLLRLLAHGQPVETWDLAAATGRTLTETRKALSAVADTEYDKYGRIIGRGLTLQPTRYQIEIDGQRLYTWCALDTLIFPAVLGSEARIQSSCHTTGVPVLVHVDAGGAVKARPETTVVSLVNPAIARSVRSAFCNQVHFFASAEAAQPWIENHPDGFVMSLEQANHIGRQMAQALLDEASPLHRTDPADETLER